MPRTDPRNVTRYWWDRHLAGLSLLHADFTSHVYPPHSHDAFVVAVTEHGGSIIRSRGTVEEAHASELFVFNPAEPHSGWMGRSRRWRYRSLYLADPAIAQVTHGLGLNAVPYFTRNRVIDADLIAGFLSLHRALEDGGDVFRQHELLVGTFGLLFRRHGSGGGRVSAACRDRAAFAKAVEIMRARFTGSLRLDELAAELDQTVFQLIGLFKKATGLTPHAYLIQMRLNAASSLLRRGVSIAETAAATGFYDQSALTRHFRRCYAITPQQYTLACHDGR